MNSGFVSLRMGGRAETIANFFDTAKVLRAWEKMERKPLDKFGAFVRRDAKGSIRQAAKTKLAAVAKARLDLARARSPATKQIALEMLIRAQDAASAPPGQPPRNVKGHLKKNIFFAWDSSTRSVVIGPVKLGEGVAPHALEFGGPSVTKMRRRNQTISRQVTIRPHPFMHPAFDKNKSKFPELFAGALNRAA